MDNQIPPYDTDAEHALVGATLLHRQAIEDVEAICSPEDFYLPITRIVYAAILDLWHIGQPVDVTTVTGSLRASGNLDRVGGTPAIMGLIAGGGFVSNVKAYAGRVVRCAAYRKLIALTIDVQAQAFAQEATPADLVDMLAAAATDIVTSEVVETPTDLWVMDEFLDRPAAARPRWVIPGLLRVGWRAMMVAPEGVGKTVLFRQLGIAAAQGIHPLKFTPMEPCRTLIVDLENPDDSIMDVCTPIRQQAMGVSTEYDPGRAWLWHRPGGINLRARRDRSELESVLEHCRPDLVCLGPIYKAYSVEARESDEQAASEVMRVLDDLRTRHQFALMLEHHAPKGSGGTRDLMPYGSSLWLRWPEIGLKMQATGEGNEIMELGRWRGDRLENDWPDLIKRSKPWPWRGVWHGSDSRYDNPPF